MLIAKIPGLLSRTFKSLTWELPAKNREVYLTFDDGPTPVVTDWVLDQLSQYGFRATFFCLGNNVKNHPEIYQRILSEGHATGNHTFSHKKGFGCTIEDYVNDIEKADELIGSDLFRPPYGRIRPAQVKYLKGKYRIIMWSVLSVDYNRNISGHQVYRNVSDNVKPGSIIVFHDSVKASGNLYKALPLVLQYLKEEGFSPVPIS